MHAFVKVGITMIAVIIGMIILLAVSFFITDLILQHMYNPKEKQDKKKRK